MNIHSRKYLATVCHYICNSSYGTFKTLCICAKIQLSFPKIFLLKAGFIPHSSVSLVLKIQYYVCNRSHFTVHLCRNLNYTKHGWHIYLNDSKYVWHLYLTSYVVITVLTCYALLCIVVGKTSAHVTFPTIPL
jgi:hypothetical protein